MTTLLDDLITAGLQSRATAHAARYGPVISDLRLRTEAQFQREIGIMKRRLATDASAAPFVEHLTGYVGWLGWSSWCSSNLAPPLGLVGEADVCRIAAAMLVYAGPRLMDDALDNHLSYKGKRTTLVGELEATHAQLDGATRRSYAMLAGTWVMLYGIDRLRRHCGPELALTTQRICERVALGGIVEGLGKPSTLAEFQHIIQMKSVWYDEILYRCLLDPCPCPPRATVLAAVAHLSRLAQYLNDIGDFASDQAAGQPNICNWLSTPAEIHALCAAEVTAMVDLIDQVPSETGDALAASLCETYGAARRLKQSEPVTAGAHA